MSVRVMFYVKNKINLYPDQIFFSFSNICHYQPINKELRWGSTANAPTLLRMSSTSFRKISSTLKLSLALASQKRIPLIREANCNTNRAKWAQCAKNWITTWEQKFSCTTLETLWKNLSSRFNAVFWTHMLVTHMSGGGHQCVSEVHRVHVWGQSTDTLKVSINSKFCIFHSSFFFCQHVPLTHQ